MHQETLTSSEAIDRLRRVGYIVEHDSARGVIYARFADIGPAERVFERYHKGLVSAYAVKRLETKMALRRTE